jgi:non-heme chloroperoxidase
MPTLTVRDGTQIFYKDWGPADAQPIVFSHGWPLSADDWDNQLLYFRSKGYRVIAHDRRGHGRSDQPDFGNDMDTYVADLAQLTDRLDLKDAIHVGHSTGGGEVTRYVARAKPGRVAKAVLISAIPPVMVKKASNPQGTPVEVFDGFRAALAANRSEYYLAVASGPFYNFDRPGVATRNGLIRNWWRQGMMGGANAGYDGVRVFSETDFTDDLKSIDVPVLVMHSKDDQVVQYAARHDDDASRHHQCRHPLLHPRRRLIAHKCEHGAGTGSRVTFSDVLGQRSGDCVPEGREPVR